MIIEGNDINLFYDIGKEESFQALKDVNFGVKKGELVGVIGPSGSGKTSLLYVLAGLKKPTSGTVYYNGIALESLSSEENINIRKKQFGFIFQRLLLLEYLTVLDNVLLGANDNTQPTKDKALELLKELGLLHLANKKPTKLSGGQRQRVAVGRALINNPSVIFADEPTSSIDHRAGMEVMNILNEFKENAAVIVVTHDKSILQNADRIVEVWEGHMK
jgi:putative ABC transport system ATP-binding protein